MKILALVPDPRSAYGLGAVLAAMPRSSVRAVAYGAATAAALPPGLDVAVYPVREGTRLPAPFLEALVRHEAPGCVFAPIGAVTTAAVPVLAVDLDPSVPADGAFPADDEGGVAWVEALTDDPSRRRALLAAGLFSVDLNPNLFDGPGRLAAQAAATIHARLVDMAAIDPRAAARSRPVDPALDLGPDAPDTYAPDNHAPNTYAPDTAAPAPGERASLASVLDALAAGESAPRALDGDAPATDEPYPDPTATDGVTTGGETADAAYARAQAADAPRPEPGLADAAPASATTVGIASVMSGPEASAAAAADGPEEFAAAAADQPEEFAAAAADGREQYAAAATDGPEQYAAATTDQPEEYAAATADGMEQYGAPRPVVLFPPPVPVHDAAAFRWRCRGGRVLVLVGTAGIEALTPADLAHASVVAVPGTVAWLQERMALAQFVCAATIPEGPAAVALAASRTVLVHAEHLDGASVAPRARARVVVPDLYRAGGPALGWSDDMAIGFFPGPGDAGLALQWTAWLDPAEIVVAGLDPRDERPYWPAFARGARELLTGRGIGLVLCAPVGPPVGLDLRPHMAQPLHAR